MLAAASAFAQQTMLRSAYFMSGYNGRGGPEPRIFSGKKLFFPALTWRHVIVRTK